MVAPRSISRRSRLAVMLAIAVGLAGATAAWYWSRPPEATAPPPDTSTLDDIPPDPRIAFPSRFRNVRPAVKYVGDRACAGCHRQIAESYQKHPMGRSAEWVARGGAVDHGAGANNPCASSGFVLSVARNKEGIVHRVSLAGDDDGSAFEVTADLAIGSGTHGRSYLTVDRGAVWQSPISWFAQAEKWDVSPGFDLANEMRRPVVPQCLQCHTDRPDPIADSLNRYRQPMLADQANIGCERCHGPGELHVAERSDGSSPTLDDSIVNPAHLDAELKADVCRQCHLQGAVQVVHRGRARSEYRPGLPWEAFASTFLRHPDLTDYRKSVGQFEQMEVSQCFTASGGKLSCTSCHDPHAKPAAADTAAYFRGKCRTCHESRGCSLPLPERRAKEDSCIACHMPARDSSTVAHVAVTDHRIMKKPDAGGPKGGFLPPGEMPLVAYRAGPHAPGAAERDRDLIVALANEFARGGASPDRRQVVDYKLEELLRRLPGDAAAWLARSRLSVKTGERNAAVAAARRAVEVNPDSEVALVQLAAAAVAAEEYDLAVETATRMVELNPSAADHLLTRGSAYFFLNDWPQAEVDCRAALAIQPLQPSAQFMIAVCRHKQGDPDGARGALARAVKLTANAEMRDRLREWYHQLTR